MKFFAHSANRGNRWEPLSEHLTYVAEKAEQFAAVFHAGQQARLAGLLHDLGKYSERFSERLRGAPVSLDHWSLGAVACALWSKRFGLAPALAVLGHHVGLGEIPPRMEEFAPELDKAIQNKPSQHALSDISAGQDRLAADGIALPKLTSGFGITGESELAAGEMLDIRMLFSVLVDADFLETEAHFEGDAVAPRKPRPVGPTLDLQSAWNALESRLKQVRTGKIPDSLRAIREQLLADCIAQGESSPTGAFTLTAPTGAGKTLAMLAFALAHARKHHLRRIVLATPFLNIVDQTAAQYDSMFNAEAGFPEHFVLEQHSLVEDFFAEPDPSQDAVAAHHRLRRQLAENWDAPIVLTTTVQLLESLHAHKPSRCRKLHRLAQAVILLDEAQTLPSKLAPLTLATLARLSDPNGPYHSSVVFATATQPAFGSLRERVARYYRSGWNPQEIVRDAPALFSAAKARTKLEWRDQQPVQLTALARELAQLPRVLAIVNLKRHAATLVNELKQLSPEGLFHLSTNMCLAHRAAVLKQIRERLDDPANPVTRVVATQCVEAGVDLDFRPIHPDQPVLFRALAPLDSIAQAAGRANRNGRSATAKVLVFQVDDNGRTTYPPGYGEGLSATTYLLSSLRQQGVDPNSIDLIHDPLWIQRYYENLYGLVGRTNQPMNDEQSLHHAILEGSFLGVAQHYRLIDDQAINIVVPYDAEAFAQLRREIDQAANPNPGFFRRWQRKARKHAVAIWPPTRRDAPLWSHMEPIATNDFELATHEAKWFWPLPSVQYDELIGLILPDNQDLIV